VPLCLEPYSAGGESGFLPLVVSFFSSRSLRAFVQIPRFFDSYLIIHNSSFILFLSCPPPPFPLIILFSYEMSSPSYVADCLPWPSKPWRRRLPTAHCPLPPRPCHHPAPPSSPRPPGKDYRLQTTDYLQRPTAYCQQPAVH
jgi:hypothetical protein